MGLVGEMSAKTQEIGKTHSLPGVDISTFDVP